METKNPTKKCPHCQTEVDPKASICPHCRGKIYQWTFTKKFIAVGICLIAFFAFIGSFSSSSSPSTPATNPEGYRIFASVFKVDAEKRLKLRLEPQFKAYVKWKLNWYPKRADGLEMSFYVQYGEVYCQLKTGSREARVKLEEIETFK